MNYKKEVLEYLQKRSDEMFFIDDIEESIRDLALKREDADKEFIMSDAFFRQLSFDVKALTTSAELMVSKKGRIGVPEAFGLIRGKMMVNDKGYGFFRPSGEARDKDVFVRKDKMLGAMNGDTVLVRKWHTNRGAEAEVKQIVKRAAELFIGRVSGGEIIPKDAKIYRKLLLAENKIGAKDGDIVMARPMKWTNDYRPIRCKVESVLGQQGDQGIDILEVAMQFGLYKEFPSEVVAESEALSEEIDMTGRVDLRNLETVTIDGADAKDIDDGISLVKITDENRNNLLGLEGGNAVAVDPKAVYRLYVHIADVSHYVKKDGALDDEAQKRGTSAYLLDRVIPMLPERLSNGLCSLNEAVERYAMTCSIDYAADGEILGHEIYKSVINVDHHLTYLEVSAYLKEAGIIEDIVVQRDKKEEKAENDIKDIENSNKNANEQENEAGSQQESLKEKIEATNPSSPFRTLNEDTMEKCRKSGVMLTEMYHLSRILRKQRMNRGAIDFAFPEPEVLLNEDGLAVDVVTRARTAASEIIEDFMLAANETVAEHFYWLETPFVYRVHEAPSKEKIERLKQYLLFFGFTLKGKDENVGIAKLIDEIKNTKYENAISMAALRSLMQAKYSAENMGHFGLHAKFYCHFTSPIRRYPDLVVHRIVSNYLAESGSLVKDTSKGLDLEYCIKVSESSSEREQNAEQAERKVNAMKMAEFMEGHIGETFQGTISSVTNYGFFVTLDNLVDGLVHVTRLPRDDYEFNEERLSLKGRRTGKVYTIGERVELTVSGADSETGKVDFSMVPDFVLEKNKKVRRIGSHSSRGGSYSGKSYGKKSYGKSKEKRVGGASRKLKKGKRGKFFATSKKAGKAKGRKVNKGKRY